MSGQTKAESGTMLPANPEYWTDGEKPHLPRRFQPPVINRRAVLITGGAMAAGTSIGVALAQVFAALDSANQSSFTKQLQSLDRQTSGDPTALSKAAPTVVALSLKALQRATQYLDLDLNTLYRNCQLIPTTGDYLAGIQAASNCSAPSLPKLKFAQTLPASSRSYFNLQTIASYQIAPDNYYPAASLLATLVMAHSLQAAAAREPINPPYAFTDPDNDHVLNIVANQGLGLIGIDHQLDSSRGPCLSTALDLSLLSLLVTRDLAWRIMNRSGLAGEVPDFIRPTVISYSRQVTKLFGANPRLLVQRQQKGDLKGFLITLGKSSGQIGDPEESGARVLYQILHRGA